MNGVLVLCDTNKMTFEVKPVNLEDSSFETVYKLINCDTIEIAYKTINEQEYMLLLDEEGKLKNWMPSGILIDDDNKVADVLANSFLLVRYDENDNYIELADKEVTNIVQTLKREQLQALMFVKQLLEKK